MQFRPLRRPGVRLLGRLDLQLYAGKITPDAERVCGSR
jgi:hypothetical protein